MLPTSPSASSGDEGSIPLTSQAYLSNPAYRKHITFVPAAFAATTSPREPASSAVISAADRYLSIVFTSTEGTTISEAVVSPKEEISAPKIEAPLCPTCHFPLSSSPPTSSFYHHECLLAHQLSLPHSHPPSYLPRSNKGLQYLSSYGWDPDGRQGLGSGGEGIKVPIKAKMKTDTSGLGVRATKVRKEEPKKQMLDAGKVRKLVREEKRKKEKLQRELWGKDDVEKYLGPG